MIADFRERYLEFFQVRTLSQEFGGSVFVFFAFSLAIYLLFSFGQSDWYGLFDFPSNLSLVEREDFAAFYRAGEMARNGEAISAYDPAVFREPFSLSNKGLLFLNPPHALLFFEPLSYMGYPAAKALGILLNFACLFGLAYMVWINVKGWPYFFMFASCGAIYNYEFLQISPVVIFLLVFALLRSRTRPLLSGLALAIATIKPQYGLLVPVFLIAVRDWRAFGFAAAGTVCLVAVSIGLYGWAVWEAFFLSLQGGAHSAQFTALHGMMTTVGHSLGKFGAGEDVRLAGQLIALPVSAAVVWFAAKRWTRERAVAVSLLAMSLAAPSFMFYDWVVYSVALFLVVKEVPRWSFALQVGAGLLWISPIVHDVLRQYEPSLALPFSGLIPVFTGIVLVLVCRRFLASESGVKSPQKADGAMANSP